MINHAGPALALVLAASLYGQVRPANPIETFSIREIFGVAHPRQIVDFDFEKRIDPKSAFMIGPQGMEVPFQLLHDGKIAVEAALAADSSAEWKLYAGHAPRNFPNAVSITETPAWYEIVNGLTGVRIARAGHAADRTIWAPIQGILYRDGTWTATGPNILEVTGKPTGMTVQFVEKGPLKVVVEVSYTIDRPPLEHAGKVLLPPGGGAYRSTIEMQAGQPSILIEDDTDSDLRYSLNIYHGLNPDQARYRGHHSTSIENGREADGRQYRQWHERPQMDAFRDLQYQTAGRLRRMAIWDPWVEDSGWYWQLYNSKAGPDANLLGIFAGRASEASGAANSGAGIFTAPAAAKAEPAAGIAFETNRRVSDATVFPRVRVSWGIFIGSKGQDLGDPYKVQNIARQMNLHGGINLNKVHRYETSFADPPGGYGPLYMNRRAVAAMIARVQVDNDYYHRLYNAEPSARPLLDMWRDASGQKLHAVLDYTAKIAHDLLDALVNGDGIYDFNFHYWHGGLEMSRQAVWINIVLNGDLASAQEKARVKAAAVLFANVLLDSDFVPMFCCHGLNLGTPNMPVQQNEYRDMYRLLLAHHPMMQGQVKYALSNALDALRHTVNESGANMASTNYIGASMGPLLSTFQQLQTAGIADVFKTEDRLTKFAEFYLNLLTPPEVRFGGYRKIISIGDGATISSELYGQLATGFAAGNPALSSRLMAAWIQGGSAHSGFHGSTILKIDDTLPAANPHLGDATFPGWYTVLRNGWATQNETAAWLVDGDFYFDHHHDDNGSVVIYALGAPLSLDWGSMYSPQTGGGFMHSVVLPKSVLRTGWDRGSSPLDNPAFRWQHATQQAFESFRASSHVRATYDRPNGTVWTRSLYSIHPDQNLPILILRDELSGTEANSENILTLNLTAEGAVETPQGPVTPPARFYATGEGPKELPSAGPVISLPAGLNRFGFTGQWAIDWDLFTFTAQTTQALIGSWGHNWHPSREQAEFKKANGRPFEEKQYIFRAKFANSFSILLLPHRKGPWQDATVKQDGSAIEIQRGSSRARIDERCYNFTDPRATILTSFGTVPCENSGIGIQGGPAEVVLEPKRVSVTAHGPAGTRTIRWPNGHRVLNYAGGPPQEIVLETRK